jgi:uncharacterized protein YqfB (UPF0267 family)
MKVKQRIQPPFNNDEISFFDIIKFFIFNKKLIVIFIIFGGVLGGLYGQFSKPIYNGSILLAPAKAAGVFIENPQKTFAIFKEKNSEFSKKILPFCPLSTLKDINFQNHDGSNFSAAKEIILIKISMQNTDETIIDNCLNHIADEIILQQNKIAQPIIDFKKNRILASEKKLKILNEVNDKIKEGLLVNKTTFNDNLLYANIIINSISEARQLSEWATKDKQEFNLDELAHKINTVHIERKTFPSFKYCAFYGLTLGFVLGSLIALIRKIKVLLSF